MMLIDNGSKLTDYNLDQKLQAQVRDIVPILRESNARLSARLQKQTDVYERLVEMQK